MRGDPLNFAEKAVIGVLFAAAWILTGCGVDIPSMPTVTPNNVLFSDSFDLLGAGNWHTEADESGRTAIEDGKMVVAVNAANMMQYTTLHDMTFDDFRLVVEVWGMKGAQESSFGILFRMEDPSQFYRFDITGDGKFMVERSGPGETWTRFFNDWQTSEAINQGEGSFNELQIEAIGPTMTFYVNDIEVYQLEDNQYSSGNIALDAGTFGQANVITEFDNISISSP